jgi:hypothetical protein
MNKLISLVLVILLILTIGVYAEDTPNIQKLLGTGYDLRYIANANNKTYVIYTEDNEIDEEYFYLGTIDNGKIASIGEVDELIGGNNEPANFEVAGITIQDKDYYVVTGMTQVNGEIYVSKKRHIYKLVADKLIEVEMTYKGKPFDVSKYNCTIGKLASNSTDMYIALRAKGHFLTGDREDVFGGPVDCMVFKVSTSGVVEPMYFYLKDLNVYASWSSWENILANMSIADNGNIASIVSTANDPASIRDVKNNTDGRVYSPGLGIYRNDGVYDNILLYNDYMLGYCIKYKQYGSDSIVIKKATLNKFTKFRGSSNGAYTTTVKAIAEIEGMYFIPHWARGADGNVYMITKDLGRKTAAYLLKK